jgi:hypothetical protein
MGGTGFPMNLDRTTWIKGQDRTQLWDGYPTVAHIQMSPFFYSNLFHLVHNFQYLYCRSHSRFVPKIATRVRRVMQPELNLPPPPSIGLDRPSHPPARPTEMFQMHVPVDHTATSLVLYCPPELVASSMASFPNGDGICRSATPMCDSSGSATNLVVDGPSLVSSVRFIKEFSF